MDNLVCKAIVGSHAYNLATADSDIDYFVVYADDPLGLLDPLQGESRSKQTTSDTEDVTYHELGKFAQLVAKNNPSVLEVLFLPDGFVLERTPVFDAFVDHRREFVSKRTINAYLGHLRSQLKKTPSSPKAARHSARLLINLSQLLQRGEIFPHLSREEVRIIRVLEANDPELQRQALSSALSIVEAEAPYSKLPDEPNLELISDIVLQHRLDMISWEV